MCMIVGVGSVILRKRRLQCMGCMGRGVCVCL